MNRFCSELQKISLSQIALLSSLCIMLTMSFTAVPVHGARYINAAPVANYQVVDLTANATDSSNIIDISGGIKNFSFTSIRGHAIVYVLDSNKNVLQGIDTDVNDGQSFRHGQTGNFEATINISGLSGVQSVSVEFVMDLF